MLNDVAADGVSSSYMLALCGLPVKIKKCSSFLIAFPYCRQQLPFQMIPMGEQLLLYRVKWQEMWSMIYYLLLHCFVIEVELAEVIPTPNCKLIYPQYVVSVTPGPWVSVLKTAVCLKCQKAADACGTISHWQSLPSVESGHLEEWKYSTVLLFRFPSTFVEALMVNLTLLFSALSPNIKLNHILNMHTCFQVTNLFW